MPADNPFRAIDLDRLRRRTSQKWRMYDADVLPMWIAEMDVPLAAPIVDALARALDDGDTGYSDPPAYIAAMRAFAGARWGWAFEPDHASGVADVMSGIAELIRAFSAPGDLVAVSPPVYPPFFDVVRHTGRRVLEAPLGPDGRLDPESLERAFAAGPALYLLCSPHNPTGAVHTRGELSALAELAARYGVRVLSDEIHAPLVLPGGVHTPYLTLPGTDDAVALLSASKGWNLAGLKAAIVVAGPAATSALRDWPHMVTDAPTHLGVIAQTAAMTRATGWLDAVVGAIASNAARLDDLLAEHAPGVTARRIDGTYLVWLDFRGTGLGDDPAAVLLERGRVALSPGTWFGTQGKGFARLNIATSPEVLDEGVRRIGVAVGGG